jgi:hypothetical protein
MIKSEVLEQWAGAYNHYWSNKKGSFQLKFLKCIRLVIFFTILKHIKKIVYAPQKVIDWRASSFQLMLKLKGDHRSGC